jgi:hypothetical protein
MEGACAHVAGADSWPPRKRSVAVAVHRIVRVIVRVIAALPPGSRYGSASRSTWLPNSNRTTGRSLSWESDSPRDAN